MAVETELLSAEALSKLGAALLLGETEVGQQQQQGQQGEQQGEQGGE